MSTINAQPKSQAKPTRAAPTLPALEPGDRLTQVEFLRRYESMPNVHKAQFLDTDNMPQPDLFLRWDEDHGGQSKVNEDDYLVGAPELVIEIAASSATIDLRDKLNAYRRNGVKEYVVWRTFDGAFDIFRLDDGDLRPVDLDAQHVFHSRAFPGLAIDVAALLAGDLAEALVTLQAAIAARPAEPTPAPPAT